MFDGIAGSYDRLNDLMTAGLHHRWRELAVMVAQVGPGCSALDVCCGTGDLAFALRRAIGPEGRVVGVDVSEEMLDVAREKCGRNQLYVEFMQGTCSLPFPDGAAGGAGRRGSARRRAPRRRASTPAPSASASATCPTSCGPSARCAGSAARGAAWSAWRSPSPRIPVFKQFYALWFRRIVPRAGTAGRPRRRLPTPTCRPRCCASRRPTS